jgi:hypothetical protein
MTERGTAGHDSKARHGAGPQLRDYDFHPGEPHVRVFTIPGAGVLRADPEAVVYQVRYGTVLLRHYAFAEHWFKINLTTDLAGRPIETPAPREGLLPFAFNCDIATPMRWQPDTCGDGAAGGGWYAVAAVDLVLDVLIRADARTHVVCDEQEFTQAQADGLISAGEASGARAGLAILLGLIEHGRLLGFLDGVAPFGAGLGPAARPQSVIALAELPAVQPVHRATW